LPGRLGLGDYDWLVFLGEDLELLLVFSDAHHQLLTLGWELVGGGLVGASNVGLTP
jgi:hypothetical protein